VIVRRKGRRKKREKKKGGGKRKKKKERKEERIDFTIPGFFTISHLIFKKKQYEKYQIYPNR
jgi:hypothetical protein